MSSRSMNLDVLVRLRDRLSGPLRRLRDQLTAIGDFARKIGAVGAAIAAISFMGPIQEAAAFQQKLLDIAGTANLSGNAAFEFVDQAKAQYEELALAAGQASDIVAAGAGQMIAAGIDRSQIDASINDIARAATAANAEFSDMAEVSTSLLQTLNVKPEGLKDSLGALVTAGKQGAFELKDMARYFPTLTSQVTKFGVKGREAVNFLGAALQIARKGTSDPAEAANNLKNFLSKILAPATIKNFKDAGIDIEAVMQDAATKGINPIEAVLQKITKLTGVSSKEIAGMLQKAKANGLEGADALASVREQLVKIKGAGALGEIFADQQVMDFLIPFLANVDEYKRIKEEVAKATGAIVDVDFETQMAGLNRQLQVFTEIGVQAGREVGLAFGSWLPMLNENLIAALKAYREWNKESGGMGTTLFSIAGGGVLAATALGALGLVLPIIGAGFAALGALLSPIGLVIAAIGAAGVLVWKNWGSVGPRVMRVWEGMKGAVSDLARGLIDFGRSAVRGAQALFERFGPAIARGLVSAWETVSGWMGRLKSAIVAGVSAALAVGKEAFDRFGPRIAAGLSSAWEDVKAGLSALKGAFDELANAIDIDVDFSGWSFDDAKLAAFAGLEKALAGIAAAWKGLKDFGSGFAPYLDGIGKSLGGTITSIERFATALASISAFNGAPSGEYFRALGDLTGGSFGLALNLIDKLGKAIVFLADGLAALSKATGVKIHWEMLLPGGALIAKWQDLLDIMQRVKGLIDSFNGVTTPDQALQTKTTNVISIENAKRAREAIAAGATNVPGSTDNQPGKLKDDLGIGAPRVIPAPPQKVDVGGQVTIKVEGPGKIVQQSSTNPQVPLRTSNTGRVVGGV